MKHVRLGAVALVAIGTLALAGCGRGGDTASAPVRRHDDRQRAGHGHDHDVGDGAEGEALPDFVKAFEDANPGVTVEVTAIPWDAAYSKIQTAIAGGTTPDIAMMGSTWMATSLTRSRPCRPTSTRRDPSRALSRRRRWAIG